MATKPTTFILACEDNLHSIACHDVAELENHVERAMETWFKQTAPGGSWDPCVCRVFLNGILLFKVDRSRSSCYVTVRESLRMNGYQERLEQAHSARLAEQERQERAEIDDNARVTCEEAEA